MASIRITKTGPGLLQVMVTPKTSSGVPIAVFRGARQTEVAAFVLPVLQNEAAGLEAVRLAKRGLVGP